MQVFLLFFPLTIFLCGSVLLENMSVFQNEEGKASKIHPRKLEVSTRTSINGVSNNFTENQKLCREKRFIGPMGGFMGFIFRLAGFHLEQASENLHRLGMGFKKMFNFTEGEFKEETSDLKNKETLQTTSEKSTQSRKKRFVSSFNLFGYPTLMDLTYQLLKLRIKSAQDEMIENGFKKILNLREDEYEEGRTDLKKASNSKEGSGEKGNLEI